MPTYMKDIALVITEDNAHDECSRPCKSPSLLHFSSRSFMPGIMLLHMRSCPAKIRMSFPDLYSIIDGSIVKNMAFLSIVLFSSVIFSYLSHRIGLRINLIAKQKAVTEIIIVKKSHVIRDLALVNKGHNMIIDAINPPVTLPM